MLRSNLSQLSFVILLGLAGLVLANISKAQVVQTGRYQTFSYSQAELHQEAERRYHEVLQESARFYQLNQDRPRLHQLRQLGHSLILAAANWRPEILDWDWELHLSSQPDLQALCMAGGKLLVNPDFLDRLALTPGETSVLLAHEIAHALAEHHREELSEARAINQVPGDELALIWERLDSDLRLQIKLATLSYLQEQEADQIGMLLALEAGVPVLEIISFYRKLAQQEQAADTPKVNFQNTHPASRSRLSMALGVGKLWQVTKPLAQAQAPDSARILAQQLGLR